jgi:hypothetical protein
MLCFQNWVSKQMIIYSLILLPDCYFGKKLNQTWKGYKFLHKTLHMIQIHLASAGARWCRTGPVVTKEGCEPAQVADVSNSPTMWTYRRGSWWPGGIATWADGLLNDESPKCSLDVWEQGTRAPTLNPTHKHTHTYSSYTNSTRRKLLEQ